jgi:carbon-monoxide dehydrogenase small subunit
VCGACTMIVDGRPVRSCISYVIACAGADVRTVEAFDSDPVMALLRSAFTRHHALQCGYCTPGMLATAYDIVTRLPGADETRIREELSGNLCRCTGYVGIVAAIHEVLARGPHHSLVCVAPASSPPPPAAFLTSRTATSPAIEARAPTGRGVALPERIQGGITLTRSVLVPVAADQLWMTLEDIGTVTRCLPGATIESVAPDGTIVGAFEVAIGPMRARFRGTARITFNSAARTGDIIGAGGVGLSRSQANGAIHFVVRSLAADSSRLDLDMTYKLNGPLAQFGRPAVVANVVDLLLADVAENLAQAAVGGTVMPSAPIGGIRLLFETLLGLVRRLFSIQ